MDNKFNITNLHLWRTDITDITDDSDDLLLNIDDWCQIDLPNDNFEAIRNISPNENEFVHYKNYKETGCVEGIEIEYKYGHNKLTDN